MKKFRCGKCGYIFTGELDFCPSCKTRLHYHYKEDMEKEAASLEEERTFRYDDPEVNTEGIKSGKAVAKIKGVEVDNEMASYFDGNPFQRFGWHLLGLILFIVSGTLLLPLAVVLNKKWEAKHTVINGFRLKFDGKARQLFGRYILWLLLTILTAGIFIFWLVISIKKWTVKHTIIDLDRIGEQNMKKTFLLLALPALLLGACNTDSMESALSGLSYEGISVNLDSFSVDPNILDNFEYQNTAAYAQLDAWAKDKGYCLTIEVSQEVDYYDDEVKDLNNKVVVELNERGNTAWCVLEQYEDNILKNKWSIKGEKDSNDKYAYVFTDTNKTKHADVVDLHEYNIPYDVTELKDLLALSSAASLVLDYSNTKKVKTTYLDRDCIKYTLEEKNDTDDKTEILIDIATSLVVSAHNSSITDEYFSNNNMKVTKLEATANTETLF